MGENGEESEAAGMLSGDKVVGTEDGQIEEKRGGGRHKVDMLLSSVYCCLVVEAVMECENMGTK